jgi:hypothetical protein
LQSPLLTLIVALIRIIYSPGIGKSMRGHGISNPEDPEEEEREFGKKKL